jgi:hypothetical protein
VTVGGAVGGAPPDNTILRAFIVWGGPGGRAPHRSHHCSAQLASPAQLAPSAQLATSETEVCTSGAGVGAGGGATFDGAAAAGPAAIAAIAAATTSVTVPLFPNAVLTIVPSLSCTTPVHTAVDTYLRGPHSSRKSRGASPFRGRHRRDSLVRGISARKGSGRHLGWCNTFHGQKPRRQAASRRGFLLP